MRKAFAYAFAAVVVALYLFALLRDITDGQMGRFAIDFVFPPAGVAHAVWLLI